MHVQRLPHLRLYDTQETSHMSKDARLAPASNAVGERLSGCYAIEELVQDHLYGVVEVSRGCERVLGCHLVQLSRVLL